MAKSDPVRASAADVVRRFSLYADLALSGPVIVSKHGRERNVILSYEEYTRLVKRDLVAFEAGDTPDEFVEDLESFVSDTAKQAK